MGTYIPQFFDVTCSRRGCTGGPDVHPDLMYAEVDNLYYRQHLHECCRWNLHHHFKVLIDAYGPPPRTPEGTRVHCRYGRACYNLAPEHLYLFYHIGDQ